MGKSVALASKLGTKTKTNMPKSSGRRTKWTTKKTRALAAVWDTNVAVTKWTTKQLDQILSITPLIIDITWNDGKKKREKQSVQPRVHDILGLMVVAEIVRNGQKSHKKLDARVNIGID